MGSVTHRYITRENFNQLGTSASPDELYYVKEPDGSISHYKGQQAIVPAPGEAGRGWRDLKKVAFSGKFDDLQGAPKELPPSGTAGGDLKGSFPNPELNEEKLKDKVISFEEAVARENIASGENFSRLFGKIKKWLSSLSTVAFSGRYDDLSGKPTIPDTGSFVPTSRRINGKALSADVSLTASDVGAASGNHTHDSQYHKKGVLADTLNPGLAPMLAGGTDKFLRSDGTWASPPAGGGSSSGDYVPRTAAWQYGAAAATRQTPTQADTANVWAQKVEKVVRDLQSSAFMGIAQGEAMEFSGRSLLTTRGHNKAWNPAQLAGSSFGITNTPEWQYERGNPPLIGNMPALDQQALMYRCPGRWYNLLPVAPGRTLSILENQNVGLMPYFGWTGFQSAGETSPTMRSLFNRAYWDRDYTLLVTNLSGAARTLTLAGRNLVEYADRHGYWTYCSWQVGVRCADATLYDKYNFESDEEVAGYFMDDDYGDVYIYGCRIAMRPYETLCLKYSIVGAGWYMETSEIQRWRSPLNIIITSITSNQR